MSTLPTPYYASEDGKIVLYQGDCADLAPLLGPFGLLLTDPPYGIDAAARINVGGGRKGRGAAKATVTQFKQGDWDKAPPSPELLAMLMGRAKHAIIWGGNYFGLPASRGWLVWDKETNGNFADCELAYTNLDIAVRKLTWRWNGMIQQNMKAKEERVHPTQKPVPVMEWCLSFLIDQRPTVFDPFAGSGTTGVACVRLGLPCVPIERDPDYCAIAAKRLREAQPMMEIALPTNTAHQTMLEAA